MKTSANQPMLVIAIMACFSVPAAGQNGRMIGNPATGSAGEYRYEGFTEPKEDIMLAADELGLIDSIDVEIGQSVKADQAIGRLEDDMQRIAVELARTQFAMTGERDATKAEMELNRSRAIQLRQLVRDEVARPDELTRAETDLQVATARHHATIEQNELRKLELRRAELQLERRIIRAPQAGVIADVFHHAGEYITPADPAIVRLMVIDKLYATFPINVEDISAIHVGTVMRLFFRSRSLTLEAPVTSIAPHVEGGTGMVKVRVELDNSQRKLIAGDHCAAQVMYGKTMEPNQPASAQENVSVKATTKR